MTPQQPPSTSTALTIPLLVSAFLETWCHQLLYVRRIYPSDTFANSYFLGLQVKVNRHPAVVQYISKAVEVAVPALMDNTSSSSSSSNRVADEFSLEIVQERLDLGSSTQQESSGSSSSTTIQKKETTKNSSRSTRDTPSEKGMNNDAK